MAPKKRKTTDDADLKYDYSSLGSCHLPVVPDRQIDHDVSGYRLQLIRYNEKKWLNGTTLKFYFFTDEERKGKPSNVELVRRAFQAWKDVGIGLNFEEVTDINDSHIRIGFVQGDGSWSYVGRDILKYPAPLERTMNFGWDLTTDPRGGGLDTPIHEIGHTLGFPHEHQNPYAGIVWDEEAVYTQFSGPPNNWPRETTYHNILRKIPESEVSGSTWDPNSIMHYGFGPGLIKAPEEYSNGLSPEDGLSEVDKDEVRKFYPPSTPPEETLEYMVSYMLELGPGEQKDLVIKPTLTDAYTIETFGKADTLIALYEDVEGEMEVIGEDDDSGRSRNAKLEVHLTRGRKYILKVRLYSKYSRGKTAVMWHD